MILIVTNEQDLTSDYIVLELSRRGRPFVRINSEHLHKAKVRFNPTLGEDSWCIELDNMSVNFHAITAAYFRRPGKPSSPTHITDSSIQRYCGGEWSALLSSALNSLETRWLNSPMAILAAEDKPRQLAMALRTGFSVPETSISNDIDEGRRLLSGGRLVAKPLREALLEDHGESKVIFTSEVKELPDSAVSALAAAPVILQRLVPKQSDIRVTVVGNSVHAAEIFSQSHADTKIDWRRGEHPDLKYCSHNLPIDLQDKCVSLVKMLGLRFSAIDFIRDLNGKYWFLEINPNGQWAWIENRTGLPITTAIVDELERIAA